MESSLGKSVEESYREFNAHLRYATFWKRFFASIIDILILIVFGFILKLFSTESTLPFLNVIYGFSPFIYSIFLHGYCGKTVGKYYLEVEVTNAKDEGAISYFQAFLRDSVPLLGLVLMYVLTFLAPQGSESVNFNSAYFIAVSLLGASQGIWYFLEFFTMLFNKKRRAIHDFIAGTVVVRT